MKRRKRIITWLTLGVVAVAAVFALNWVWKVYGLPELPDRREYKTIEERAAELGDAYCQLKHPLVIEQINKELNVINKQITWKRKSKKVLGIYSWKH